MPQSKMIRQAVRSDADSIIALLLQVASVHADLYPDRFKQGGIKYTAKNLLPLFDRPDCVIFVAETADGVVGGEAICYVQFVAGDSCLQSRKTLFVEDFCVDNSIRRQGLGSQLMEYMQTYAKEHGFEYIELNCWSKNREAFDFYTARGFIEQKVRLSLKI